jgi:geranylgeranyl transferase type-1 subunit beta
LTYCALSALSLLNHLHPNKGPGGVSSHDNIIRWLVSRQLPFETKDGYSEGDYEDLVIEGTEDEKRESKKIELGADGKPIWGGFNGRCNKRADTCYSFWVGGSLNALRKLHLIDMKANRRFLLEKTQHFIGGFAKLPQPPAGTPPGMHLPALLDHSH